MSIRIVSTGAYLPEKVVTNDYFKASVQQSNIDQYFSGIEERRHASIKETSIYMGTQAAKQALERSKIAPDDIELLLFHSVSPDMDIPGDGVFIQVALQLKNAVVYGIDTACSSFLSQMHLANSLIKGGSYKNALIVVSMNWVHRICDKSADWSMVGDGAGAVIVEQALQYPPMIIKEQTNIDYHDIITKIGEHLGGDGFLHFKKHEKFGSNMLLDIAQTIRDFMTAAQIAPGQVDWLVCHQPGVKLIDLWRHFLEIPQENHLFTVQKTANMAAANIPYILDYFTQVQPKIRRGDTLLLFANGGGGHLAFIYLVY